LAAACTLIKVPIENVHFNLNTQSGFKGACFDRICLDCYRSSKARNIGVDIEANLAPFTHNTDGMLNKASAKFSA